MSLPKGRKTDNKSLIQTLTSGPTHNWGPDEDEQKAIKEAKEILVGQLGDKTYREKLLNALLYFTRQESYNDGVGSVNSY